MEEDKRNRIFQTAEEAQKHLEEIIEHSFDGIYITDGNGNTIMVNRAYEQITGLKKKEVLGKNMESLVRSGVISVSGSLHAIRENRVVTLSQEFKTGKKAVITSSPIYDEDGDISMVVTNVRDLTEIYQLKERVVEQKQEEEKLRQNLMHVQNQMMEEDMIVQDENALRVVFMADKVAPLDATVMLLGETGVGKEVFARYIFKKSHRKDQNFIKVNCGAIPENLLESELFGYEKGAFTGASRNGKIGLFELADKGTMYLLKEYQWPGNIRELKNIVERAIIISNGDEIDQDAVPIFHQDTRARHTKRTLRPVRDLGRELQRIEAGYMEEAYETYGNVRDAAESLGMNASTFVRKRKKYQETIGKATQEGVE